MKELFDTCFRKGSTVLLFLYFSFSFNNSDSGVESEAKGTPKQKRFYVLSKFS